MPDCQHPTRKPHRLKNYDYSSPGSYFVTFCTKERRPILSEIIAGTSIARPPEVLLLTAGSLTKNAIEQIPDRYPAVSVDQYVIMPNHIHLLLRIDEAPAPSLGRIIQHLKGYVTKNYGTAIWQEKYYDHVIRGENDFLAVYQYICDNPAKWAEDEYHIDP